MCRSPAVKLFHNSPYNFSNASAANFLLICKYTFFENRNIPLAINHCVAIYPSEKDELDLNQIDFLKKRFPNNIIGFSTHEKNEDIEYGMMIAYAKGARTFERHIDIDTPEDWDLARALYNAVNSLKLD